MDPIGPIGGPAFSSQALIGGPGLVAFGGEPQFSLSKTSHSGFPTLSKVRQIPYPPEGSNL